MEAQGCSLIYRMKMLTFQNDSSSKRMMTAASPPRTRHSKAPGLPPSPHHSSLIPWLVYSLGLQYVNQPPVTAVRHNNFWIMQLSQHSSVFDNRSLLLGHCSCVPAAQPILPLISNFGYYTNLMDPSMWSTAHQWKKKITFLWPTKQIHTHKVEEQVLSLHGPSLRPSVRSTWSLSEL